LGIFQPFQIIYFLKKSKIFEKSLLAEIFLGFLRISTNLKGHLGQFSQKVAEPKSQKTSFFPLF
jgi:hypothetical protein